MEENAPQIYIKLTEYVVAEANTNSLIAKSYLKRFETLESCLRAFLAVHTMPEGHDKDAAKANLSVLAENLNRLTPLGDNLRDWFARSETNRERIEASLQAMKQENSSGNL